MANKKGKVAKTGIHDARVTTRRLTFYDSMSGVNAFGWRICRYHPAIARLRQFRDGKPKAWQPVTGRKGAAAEWHCGTFVRAKVARRPAGISEGTLTEQAEGQVCFPTNW